VASLMNLTTLSLSSNQISDISAVKDLTNLITLYLFNNQISDISALASLIKLTSLDFSLNQISDISALADLTKLIELDLGWNKINDITALAGLNRLQYLSIHRNRISSISAITNLTSLKYLNLDGNPLDADSVNVYIPQIHQANPEIDLIFVPLGEILLVIPFDDFEMGDFNNLDWKSSGDAEWVISTEAHSGNYCAQAGSINNNDTSTLSVILDCVEGNITFYCKISSEQKFDYLKFYIDGAEQDKWSGDQGWIEVSFPVEAGTRTFEWTYSKDSSTSRGEDTAWIDDIVFPCN
ncbi:MAG: leucine-rich repeat domain-containing protein, partial [Sedimentisphaerales bacterium]